MQATYPIDVAVTVLDRLSLAGFEVGDLLRACHSERAPEDLWRVLNGTAKVVLTPRMIDTSKQPSIPSQAHIVRHNPGPTIEWDSRKVGLYVSEKQRRGRVLGSEIRDEVLKQPVLNACVSDAIAADPRLFSEAWRGKTVHFWGTEYAVDETAYIMCLSYSTSTGRLESLWTPLDHEWDENDVALIWSK